MSNAQSVGSVCFHRGRVVALKTFREMSFDRCIEAFLAAAPVRRSNKVPVMYLDRMDFDTQENPNVANRL
jgi:hypothetical protein